MSEKKKESKPQTPKMGENKSRTFSETRKRSAPDGINKLDEAKQVRAMEVPKRPVKPKAK